MSNKRRFGMGDHDMLVAAIREKENLQREYNVVAYTAISFSDRLGVLVVRTECRKVGEALTKSPVASYEGTWPNAQAIGWPAFLFQHMCRLEMLVRDSLGPLVRE